MGCCGDTFKVPHTDQSESRGELVRVYVRIFVFIYAPVVAFALVVAALIRVELDVPSECSGLTESVFVAPDMLMAMCAFSFLALLFTFFWTKYIRKAVHLRDIVNVFVLVVFAQVFIAIMAAVQSNRMTIIVNSFHEVFTDRECLNKIQSEHQCCGFKTYKEWLADTNRSDISDGTDTSSQSPFPTSCICSHSEDDSCVQVNHSIPVQNSTSSLNKGAAVVSYFVYSTPCFSSIKRDLDIVQRGSAAATIIAIGLQLFIFAIQFFLIQRRLSAAASAKDDDNTSSGNYRQRLERRRSQETTSVDVSDVQLRTKRPDTPLNSDSPEHTRGGAGTNSSAVGGEQAGTASAGRQVLQGASSADPVA